MKKEDVASGVAIGASLLIGSCCLAPTLFLLFGASAGMLGAFSALEPHRPVFIALFLAALLYAGVRLHQSRVECEDTTCAPDALSRRRARRLFMAAVVIFAVATAYPIVLNWVL